MKSITILLLFFSTYISRAQDIPSDSILLKSIYKKVDKGGMSYTRPYTDEETPHSYYDSVRYEIKFKDYVVLDGIKFLLVITEAPCSNLHGHTLGYSDLYYLQNINSRWIIKNKIISESALPIGDAGEYSIVQIGKNKKALVSTFQSTGNQHFENTLSFFHLQLTKTPFLFELHMEYSNNGNVYAETPESDCPSVADSSSYAIIKSDKEWWDVKVRKTNFRFTKGCENKVVESIEKILIYYNGKEYVEKKL